MDKIHLESSPRSLPEAPRAESWVMGKHSALLYCQVLVLHKQRCRDKIAFHWNSVLLINISFLIGIIFKNVTDKDIIIHKHI